MKEIMEHPFAKSTPMAERCRRLLTAVGPEDTLAIVINADPDAMASALALKRLFWRRVAKATIYHTNVIKRADNLALIKLLKMDQTHIRNLKRDTISKFAIVDSQPHHDAVFERIPFDIIIDHHPPGPDSKGFLVDVREEYGANSTIMTEYLRAARIKPSPRLATALFYGIKTDTDNFARDSQVSDIEAFRYLYRFANLNVIKKIEFSEMTHNTLASYRDAMDRLTFAKGTVFVHMGEVSSTDTLVMIADFFMKLAEAGWSVVSGINGGKLIVIYRNAELRGDAGRKAKLMFDRFGASAGGHKSAARAEVPMDEIAAELKGYADPGKFVMKLFRETK
ncbi:MAG: DHH family phosphoesterase [Deltaproteobacteria bacterium]|nr:DHH family phosphoesterase [Deltaproteobacteria bacterium]MBW1818508.1 DHH family phosphoesterase [Deltaproteobacteria bacterium]MBW2283375.1 DHH family phosphoesterase [Deltaproteobacteria bacterium]